jgi:TonB family protein
MLEIKELKAGPDRRSGRRLADEGRPMTGFKLFLSRMNGWALSLLLHGGVAALAGISVFTVHMGGGSGRSAGGSDGSGMATPSFAATLRSGDEQVVSGTLLPDAPQFGRLTSEETPLDPITEELPVPVVPFDVFAVGSSEPAAPSAPQPPLPDPLSSRPGSFEGRTTKLPAATGEGQEGQAGSSGREGSGGGDDSGDGSGQGNIDGDGRATGVYTPAPAYPSEARRRNIEGSVLVDLAIAADGSCAVRRIVESSGFSPLDDAVQATVKHWKYRPADDDGRPENTTKRMRFTFRLGR